MPSISFVNSVPHVMTCADHDKGSKNMMIHTCRWEHNLPAADSDQVAQVVTQCRVVKTGKASKFSTEWQMMEQHGSFQGLHTCNHIEFGNFDKYSILRFDVERRSIHHRYDIDSHLDTLCKNNVISSVQAKDMRDDAATYCANKDFSKLYKGATYITLDAAMAYQQESRDRTISILMVNTRRDAEHDSDDHHQPVTVQFHRYWPYYTYPCQKCCSYGCMVATVPKFTEKRNQCFKQIWKVSAMLLQVEKIWQLVADSTTTNDQWHGWLLVYLTKHCWHTNKHQSRKDPFKYTHVSTYERLHNKLPTDVSDSQLFQSVNGIYVLEIDDVEDDYMDVITEEIDGDEYEVVVFAIKELEQVHTRIKSTIQIDNHEFELRCQISIQQNSNNRSWKGNILSRHGLHFNGFWCQNRSSNIPIQAELPLYLYPETMYTFIYVRCDEVDIKSYQNEYLRLIGGQSHVQCFHHHLPLIASYDSQKNADVKVKKQHIVVAIKRVMLPFARNVLMGYKAMQYHMLQTMQWTTLHS